LILTLDGGGIRGFSSLIILRALMKEIAVIEAKREPPASSSAHSSVVPVDKIPAAVYKEGQYLPCHYFDYIAGTSFGGLIAIMLGMLSMNVDDCIAEFHRQNEAIPLANNLPNPLVDLPLLRRRTTWPTKKSLSFFETFARFSAVPTTNPARAALPSSASSSGSSSTSSRFQKSSLQCQTLAWCSEVDGSSRKRPHAFCSYEENDASLEQGSDNLISIPEVAKAITAPWQSPFKPFKLGSGHFVDGSGQIRDPTIEVLKEITVLLENGSGGDGEPAIDLLLSLGTDEHHVWFYEKLRGEKHGKPAAENEMSQQDCHVKEYHRFQVPDIRLGLRRKCFLAEIEQATESWLQSQKAQITKVAEVLVRRRLERSRTTRWETFALETRYRCFHKECRESVQVYEDRGTFFDHLDKSHKLSRMAARKEADIEEELDKGQKFGDPSAF
jgi:hypothetical protein